MPRWGKHIGGRKNHIKYAYFLRSKPRTKYSKNSETPKYLFAYLTDDNKVFFDEFHVKNRRFFKKSTIYSFVNKVKSHYMDSSTEVYYYFGEGDLKRNDVIFILLNLYHYGVQFNMTKVPLGVSAKKISGFFNLGIVNYRRRPYDVPYGEAMKDMYKLYDVILKNRICPWINDEFNQRIELIKSSRRKMYKVVTMGLLHMVIKYTVPKVQS